MRAPSQILMVDDCRTDARLFQAALEESDVPVRFTWLSNVNQALAQIRQDFHSSGTTPDLILLDINLPGINGWQLLREIKGDPCLRRIPVLVLSTSTSSNDIQQAYSLDANCYMVKPMDWEEYVRLARILTRFWLQTATLSSTAAVLPSTLAEVA